MAGELIGALRVALGWDTAEFTAGSKKAKAEARATAQSIQSSLDGLRGTITAAFTGAIATAAIGAAKRALDYASSLGEVSQQLGVTTRDLQVYRYAASQAGVSQDEMDAGLARLTRTIGDAAAGSKAQATVFRELGVSVQTANGEVRTAGEVLPDVADALSKIKDPATRARVEVDLFGKAGQKLDPLLSSGRKGIDELTGAAEKLGVVLDTKLIQQADDAADKLSAMNQVLEAKIAVAVAENAGAIVGLADSLLSLSTSLARWWGQNPEKAAGVMAALAGGAVGMKAGGLPGAIAGAGIGQIAGTDYRSGATFSPGRLLGMGGLPGLLIGQAAGAAGRYARGGAAAKGSPPAYIGDIAGSIASLNQQFGAPGRGTGGLPTIKSGAGKKAKAGKDETADRLAHLRSELLPLSTALKQAASDEEFLNRQLAAGKISADDHALALQALGDKTHKLIVDTDRLPLSIEKVDASFDGLTDVAARATDVLNFTTGRTAAMFEDATRRTEDLARTINDDLTQGLEGLLRGFNSLGDVAISVIEDIGRALLANLGGVSGGTGGIGGIIANGILGAIGGGGNVGVSDALKAGPIQYGSGRLELPSLPKFARGGTIGGLSGTDRNLLSLNGMPTAWVGRGEQLRVEPNNDNGARGAVYQTITFSGAVDIADRAYVNKMAMAAKQGAVDAMDQRGRRR